MVILIRRDTCHLTSSFPLWKCGIEVSANGTPFWNTSVWNRDRRGAPVAAQAQKYKIQNVHRTLPSFVFLNRFLFYLFKFDCLLKCGVWDLFLRGSIQNVAQKDRRRGVDYWNDSWRLLTVELLIFLFHLWKRKRKKPHPFLSAYSAIFYFSRHCRSHFLIEAICLFFFAGVE